MNPALLYDQITRVGPGTPAGNILRRYWHLGFKNQVQHALRNWRFLRPWLRPVFSSPRFFEDGRSEAGRCR
ncbi:MAG: hypothetical protein H5U26_14540 [Immundisolibacter sp.]|nr:hypothetical protein [Immundisolibacter sp.]